MNPILAISPIWITALLGIVVLMLDALSPKEGGRGFLGYVSAGGMALIALWTAWLWKGHVQLDSGFLSGMLQVDTFGMFFTEIVFLTGIGAAVVAADHMVQQHSNHGEVFGLLVLSATGMIVFITAIDLIVMFLGLETMSLAIYAMAASKQHSSKSTEAGLKYFVLGGLASAFLLFGTAMLYGVTGSTNLQTIARYYSVNPADMAFVLYLAGLAFILVGLGFKIAAVPFHFWTPDVYQGAPTPITMWMAGAVKAAGFAVFARVVLTLVHPEPVMHLKYAPMGIVLILALLTMTYGNIVGIVQDDVKRILAYSSIAHAGYLLLGVYAVGPEGLLKPSVVFYLLTYALATVGAFGVISLVGGDDNEDLSLDRMAGFGRNHPLLGLLLMVSVLSLAGIPPFAGFTAKFYLFKEVLEADPRGNLPYVIFAVVNSLIALYYYLRIVVAIYMEPQQRDDKTYASIATYIAVGVAVAGILVFGLIPSPLMVLARHAVAFSVLAL